MRVILDYGLEGLAVEVPDDATVIEPVFREAVPNAHETIIATLRTPIGCPPLREIAHSGARVAISVCDVTRAQPRKEMLRAVIDEMPEISAGDITILIATGTHRANSAAEL